MTHLLAVLIVLLGAGLAALSPARALERERLNESRSLSQTEMGALLMALLDGRAGVSDLRIDGGDVVFRASGRNVRMGLVPLSRQFNALPDAKSRQEAYDKLTQRIVEAIAGQPAAKSEAEVASFVSTLVPVLKNRSYVEHFAAQARKQGVQLQLLHLPLAGDIVVAAASDLPKITRFLAVGEGGAYGMSDADVMNAALDNWTRRASKIEVHDLGLVRAFHFGEGDYNASILVLPNPWEKVPDLPRSVAISIPSRDVFAFADAEDPRAVAALRALTKRPDRGFPVSKQLYRLSAKGLEVFR